MYGGFDSDYCIIYQADKKSTINYETVYIPYVSLNFDDYNDNLQYLYF